MKKKLFLLGLMAYTTGISILVIYFLMANCGRPVCNDINAVGCICKNQKTIFLPRVPRQTSLEPYCIDSCKNEGGFLNYICTK